MVCAGEKKGKIQSRCFYKLKSSAVRSVFHNIYPLCAACVNLEKIVVQKSPRIVQFPCCRLVIQKTQCLSSTHSTNVDDRQSLTVSRNEGLKIHSSKVHRSDKVSSCEYYYFSSHVNFKEVSVGSVCVTIESRLCV